MRLATRLVVEVSFLSSLVMLASCATRKDALYTQKWDKKLSSEEIKRQLSRTQRHPAYAFTAIVKTRALIEATENEFGLKNREARKAITEKINSSVKYLVETASCFSVTIESVDMKHGYFRNWQARLSQSGKGTQIIRFETSKGQSSVPKIGKLAVQSPYQYFNSTVACALNPIDLSRPFQMSISPIASTGLPKTELVWKP